MERLHVLRGAYRGQLIQMEDDVAALAIADKWATYPGGPPQEVFEEGTEVKAGDYPQSLIDFEAGVAPAPPDPPPEDTRSTKRARKSSDDDE